MISDGRIVLFRFPQMDQTPGKLRPALVIRRVPGPYDDWLTCMLSSRLDQAVPNFDEIIAPSDSDFAESGLRDPSVIRLGILVTTNRQNMMGELGQIGKARLERLRENLSRWIQNQ